MTLGNWRVDFEGDFYKPKTQQPHKINFCNMLKTLNNWNQQTCHFATVVEYFCVLLGYWRLEFCYLYSSTEALILLNAIEVLALNLQCLPQHKILKQFHLKRADKENHMTTESIKFTFDVADASIKHFFKLFRLLPLLFSVTPPLCIEHVPQVDSMHSSTCLLINL